jgi:hypothetical protein
MALQKMTVLWLVLAACGGMASAADWYLSPDGDDASPGSIALPWKTFSHATGHLVAGDTLFLRAGIYTERLILSGKSGTSEAPIVIRAHEDELPVIDGATITVPAGGRVGLVELKDCSHIQLQGIEIRNFNTSASNLTPVGILIEGAGSGLKILGNKVHHIWQSSTNSGANGFGIAVYGTAATPIDGLTLEGNEVYDLRTGQSESVVLNGNVTNFLVHGNHVHDCNNIGIDLIGYEGSAPAEFDRARDGICSENHVHGIDSSTNPGYGGSFTNGGGDRSAAGIYVDGGTRITVERNHVHDCNFGIELASEHAAGFTDEITVRNNLLHHNMSAGLIMGGYDSARGKTRLCRILNNTLFRNDTLETYSGQIALQFYLEDNIFKNNIVWANAATHQMIIHYVEGGTAAQRAFGPGNVFDHNIYFCEGDETGIEFGLNPSGSGGDSGNKSYNGLAAWRTASGGDAQSAFHNPGFQVAVPGASPATEDFRLSDTSFCRDRGEPSPPYVPATGEKDLFGSSRVANSRVDVGMHEFMSRLQSWRDSYFTLPDGGPGAGDLDDPDSDGLVNLMEYSQGMNPILVDMRDGPQAALENGLLRFFYRKDAPELTYQVLTSPSLGEWEPATGIPELADGNGNYWREFPLSGESLFLRLRVIR